MILVRLTARCKFALIVKRLMFIYFNLTYFVCSVSQHVHVYKRYMCSTTCACACRKRFILFYCRVEFIVVSLHVYNVTVFHLCQNIQAISI